MPSIILKNNEQKRSLFFSFIPKTGGTSIIKFFNSIGAEIYLHNENNPIIGLLRCPSQHFHYELNDQIHDLGKYNFSFSIVRNPISRIKSDYLWTLRNHLGDKKFPSFEEWFSFVYSKYKENKFFLDNHLRPQSEFVGEKINKIYKYEDGLENAILDIFKNLNIRVNLNNKEFLPKENTSFKNTNLNSSNVQINSQIINIIRDLYSEDFEKWYS